MIPFSSFSRGVIAVGALAGATILPAAAQGQELFSGKTVTVVIGYAAGGGYDRYGRQVARHIGKYLPGQPTVVAQNRPGAGSYRAVNYIYHQAPKDGTAFGIFARAVPILAFAGKAKQADFDPRKLTWIGTSSSYKGEAYLMVVRKDTGVKSINDLRNVDQPLNFAATSFGSDGTDVPIVLRNILKLNIQPLRGYPGGNTLYLAVDRGEAQGRMVGYASAKTARPGWLEKDSPIRVVLQFATKTRLPDFPDVPTAQEVVTDPDDKALIEMLEAPFYMARPFAGPPGLSAEATKALRVGFMKAHEDPKYQEEAKKLRLLTSPASGEDVQALVERLSRMDRKLYDRYSKILENPKSPLRKVEWIKVSGVISKMAKKGRFEFQADGKTHKSRMAGGGYTKVEIDGKKANRKEVKAGMNCEIWWEGPGSYAGRLICKN